MADFGSRNMGFFGGTSSGGGGTSTGINGLNGTTNIGLGGTLANNTFINIVDKQLTFGTSTINGIFNVNTFFTWDFTDIGNRNYHIAADGIGSLDIDTTNAASQKALLKLNGVYIKTLFNGADLGLNLDFTNREFTLGDYDDVFTKTKLVVDDVNGWVYTDFFATSQCGIFLTEDNATFSAFDGTNKIGLNIAGSTKEFNATYGSGIVNGLSLNFASFVYKFGGFDVASNDNLIQIDDTNNSIETLTSNLIFTGASLQSNSSGGNSGEHLVITLNGSPYKIALQDP